MIRLSTNERMQAMNAKEAEDRERIKNDFSLALGEIQFGWYVHNGPVLEELLEAERELYNDEERDFRFEWNVVDIDISDLYIHNITNGHRYHICVMNPAALYVDVYRILDDGTEVWAFKSQQSDN